jgi:pimeloyl-ACP methyl ester carboxylesterase
MEQTSAQDADGPPMRKAHQISRRKMLAWGLAATGGVVAAAAAGGVEMVNHGVLPGKSILDQIDGTCDVTVPPFETNGIGESVSGSFYSRARKKVVGYAVGYPPGHLRGTELPLIVMLHGEGGNHRSALSGLSPSTAMGLRVDGSALAPMAIVTVDGGRGYWHPHAHDDPMGMVVDELIPMLQRWGLGRPPHHVATMGTSMGGYGAVLFAELHPELFRSVAAISPAIWTSYAQASAVNAGAYDSAAQFARFDAVSHGHALDHTPVRIASGYADPFHPGVVALTSVLGPTASVAFSGGCHTGAFFEQQEPPSLSFLSRHLSARAATT